MCAHIFTLAYLLPRSQLQDRNPPKYPTEAQGAERYVARKGIEAQKRAAEDIPYAERRIECTVTREIPDSSKAA